MTRRPILLCAMLAIIALVLLALNIACGTVSIPVADVVGILLGGDAAKESWTYIIMESRLPQAVTALLSGAALAVSGLMLQTAFRNPLADPSIFGVSSGAGLGVALVVLLFGGSVSVGTLSLTGFAATMLPALAGALAVIGILLAVSRMVRSSVMLLIVGIMIGYLVSSAVSLLNFFATDEGVKSYLVWGMGSFAGVSRAHLPLFSAVALAGIAAALLLIKPLNALLLGDRYAENLGVRPRRIRCILLLLTGLLTALVTAYCGPIAFIGLACPHIARLLMASDDHRALLPATLLTGSLTALLCNLLCLLPSDATVLPLNVMTPIIGAPVIIYVIVKEQRG